MEHSLSPRPLAARRAGPLAGKALVPGDKSISHRALILAALAVGETRIAGLLEAEDVINTAHAMRALGAGVARGDDGVWRVWGAGVGGLAEPDDVLDFGNSGTGSRLVMGAVATTPISVTFTGDASLRARPMRRVIEPLGLFGAEASGRAGGFLPLTLRGARTAVAVEHEVAVASAQVKSALLLAALNASGRSRIAQKVPTRDHTERMLKAFGAEIAVERLDGGGEVISLQGEAELRPAEIAVPRDPSSAAFPLAAALLIPGSDIVIPDVLLNARRTGLIETLSGMGAKIGIENTHEVGGETVGDLHVRASALSGVEVPPERAASMIDEYPVLSIIAAFAEGRTVMRGLEELRVKESDRLAAIADGLRRCGVSVEELPDGLIVEGRGLDGVAGGARVTTRMDHRIAMSFLVAGMASRLPVSVDDASMIATSFPEFEQLMRGLGTRFMVPNA